MLLKKLTEQKRSLSILSMFTSPHPLTTRSKINYILVDDFNILKTTQLTKVRRLHITPSIFRVHIHQTVLFLDWFRLHTLIICEILINTVVE